MRKRLISLVLLTAMLLAGCAAPEQNPAKQYEASFLDLFDTITTILGKAESEDAFRTQAQRIHDELQTYHRLFDIYNEYDGVNNLKTVNDQAGIAPVRVDRKIIDLLLDCRDYYDLTGGKVNAAMGSVLSLWHDARSQGSDDPRNARLPDTAALEEASRHTDFSAIVIDETASTVYISDPEVSLDVGAVAKGWSVEQVCRKLPSGMLVSVGGNVRATGPKDDIGTPWVVGVENPNGGKYLHTLYLNRGSMVTSGDYQRNYAVDGIVYHHIIDPETLFPSTYWRSVTILCEDSGLADALSTALFLLPQAEGQALLDQCGAEAMWMDGCGNLFYSPGFEDHIRS